MTNFNMDTSDVLALIAIVVSIGSAFFQWYMDSHINKVNLEADYFKELYSKHLLYEIPRARGYIRFDNNKLVDFDKLLDELSEIRQNSLYFSYADSDFYLDVKNALQGLEDYLIEISSREFKGKQQDDIKKQIQTELQKIYKLFNSKSQSNF